MELAIRTEGLAKKYRGRAAVRGINLEVPPGRVFGYLGPNGAGKTTTIRILAGLLRPSAGHAEVLGMDVVAERESVQRRIGYLPGDFVAYPDLTGAQYVRFLSNLRGGRGWPRALDLADRLGVDFDTRISRLSHGNRQKLGLVQAFMHDPDVLILDEPTSGLDPLVQRQFLEMVREAGAAGRTVFLSSHVLSEVEVVADTVAMLRDGELVVVESVGSLKSRARRHIQITFEREPPAAELRSLAAVRSVEVSGLVADLVVAGSTAALFDVAAPYGVSHVVTHEPDLEEIFLTYYATEAHGAPQRVH